MLVLGIESSCDETGVALYCSGQGLIADALYSQVELHKDFGGVVPELASRDHIRKIYGLVQTVLSRRISIMIVLSNVTCTHHLSTVVCRYLVYVSS